MRIGLYSPFLGSTIGGGEKYFGVAAEAVRDGFPDANIEILTPVPVDVKLYESMLGLDLRGVGFRSIYRSRDGTKSRLNRVPVLRRYRDLVVSMRAAKMTERYDLLLSMVYVLPAVSRARRGVILCQFPYERQAPVRPRGLPGAALRLHDLVFWRLRRRLLGSEVDDFNQVICQSEYVRQWVMRFWARDSLVVYPPIDVPDEEPDWAAKRNAILAVGRFFAGGHNKRHDLMIEAFRRLCDRGLRGWELHLVGSVHRTTVADAEYFERVVRLAEGYPVFVHPNAPRDEVQRLYQQAAIYWHAAGYGVDAEQRPAELEHFGMTTVEAMAYGAVPVVIARGGQVEVVEETVSGYLWTDPAQLQARTLALIADPRLRQQVGAAARHASFQFSRARFKRQVADAVGLHVDALRSDSAAPGSP